MEYYQSIHLIKFTVPRFNQQKMSYLRWFIFLLPLLSVLSSSLSCIVSYLIGLYDKTIKPLPFVPFISDTGNLKPNSSYFTFGMTMSCIINIFIVVFRFYYFQQYFAKHQIINKVSLGFGLALILGKLMVSSFQLSSNVYLHYTGAALFFFGSCIYMCLQSILTYYYTGKFARVLFYSRVVASVGMFLSVALFFLFMIPKLSKYNRNGENIAQTAEWCFAALKSLYMLTLMYDTWKIDVSVIIKYTHMVTTNNDIALATNYHTLK